MFEVDFSITEIAPARVGDDLAIKWLGNGVRVLVSFWLPHTLMVVRQGTQVVFEQRPFYRDGVGVQMIPHFLSPTNVGTIRIEETARNQMEIWVEFSRIAVKLVAFGMGQKLRVTDLPPYPIKPDISFDVRSQMYRHGVLGADDFLFD